MSVGHGGDESRHSGKEKVFILEWLENRLKDVVEDYNDSPLLQGKPPVSVEVYDPYNADMDFFVLIKADRETFNETYKVYEEIYNEYHSRKLQRDRLNANKNVRVNEENFREKYMRIKKGRGKDVHGNNIPLTNNDLDDFNEIKKEIFGGYDEFHAAKSKTIMFYSIKQMAKLYGEERVT